MQVEGGSKQEGATMTDEERAAWERIERTATGGSPDIVFFVLKQFAIALINLRKRLDEQRSPS